MIKKFIIPVLCISSWVHAQFPIQGELKGYESKPVLIKIYNNGSPELTKRLNTDASGKFVYNHPEAYTGKVIFELVEGSFEIIAANEPVQFSMDVNDPQHDISFEGGINQQINENFALVDKKALRDFTLEELLKLYEPQDEFYQALQKEIKRIDNLSLNPISNEAVQYYVDAKNELGTYSTKELTADEILEKSKHHLVMDNMNLENFGLLPEFLSSYISYSVARAVDRDDAANKIEKALDSLLDEAQRDTSRGQAILTTIIPLLEGNGFKDLSDKYLSQADSLTCEISPELKELLVGKKNIKEGAVVPNIVFDKKNKKAKSLYDVKADKKLLIFWASWCPHCMNELPKIKAFYDDFVDQGGEIVAISLDLDENAYKQAIEGTGWVNYSDLKKWDSPFVSQFGVSSTPTMILLDKDNKVIQKGSRISEFK